MKRMDWKNVVAERMIDDPDRSEFEIAIDLLAEVSSKYQRFFEVYKSVNTIMDINDAIQGLTLQMKNLHMLESMAIEASMVILPRDYL